MSQEPMLKESPGGNWRIVWPIALACTVIFASSRAVPAEFAPLMEHKDKLVHFFVFGLFATLVVRLHVVQRNRVLAAVIGIAVTSLFGVSDEVHQAFTPGRSSDVLDWAADTLGAMVAVWCYLGWTGYRRLLEWRVLHRGENLRVEMLPAAVPNATE